MTEAGRVSGSVFGAGGRSAGLRVKAIDAFDGATALSNPFTVEVLRGLTMTPASWAIFENGWPASFAPPSVQNAVGDVTWSVRGPGLPEGITVDPRTGVISGKGTVSTPANDGYRYVARDSYDGAEVWSEGFVVMVRDETAFAVLPVSTGTLRARNALTVAASVQGKRGTLSWALKGDLPGWATFEADTGRIVGIPPAQGTWGPFTLTATDSVLAKAVDSPPFSIVVIPAADVSIAATAKPAQQGKAYEILPVVSDAVGTYAVRLAEGTLPDGLALDAATGRISGVPKVAGTYPGIYLAVRDSRATGSVGPLVISVAPGFGPDGLPYAARMPRTIGGTPDAAVDETPVVTGFAGELAWSVESGTLPPWLTLDTRTGRVSGMPTGVGTWPDIVLKVKDADGIGVVSNAFTVSVNEIRVLRATIAPSVGFDFGVRKEVSATLRNATGAVTWRLGGTLPPGLLFDSETGKVSGTATQTGSFPDFVLTARDATGAEASTDPFAIVVTRGSIRAVGTASNYVVDYRTTFAIPAPNVSGAVGDTRWAMAAGTPLPAWAALGPNGEITAKPNDPSAIGITGPYTLQVSTDIQEGVVDPAFTIEVPRPDFSARAYSALIPGRVGQPVNARPAAAGKVGAVTWVLEGTLPEGLGFEAATGAIAGIPTQAGTANDLVLTATDAYDGRTAATARFSVAVVERPTRLDVTGPGDVSALSGESFTAPAPATTNAFGAVRWSAKTTLPAWLGLDGATGVLSGIPPAVADVQGIVISAVDSDGVAGETAPFAVKVGPNLKLSAMQPSYPASARKPATVPAPTVANATGAVTWTLARGVLPAGMQLAAYTGVISGTPAAAGTANGLALRATDARGDAAETSAFGIVVAGLAVSNVSPSYALTAGERFEMPAPTASGNSGMVSWVLESGTLPAWASFDGPTGKITGTPPVVDRTSGLRLQATDAGDNSAKSPFFTLAVDAKLAVDGMLPSYEYPVGEAFSLLPPTPRDPVGGLTWVLDGTLPEWLKFDAPTGKLSGTPPAKGEVGPLTLRVSDTTLKSLQVGTFTIKVVANVKVGNVPAVYPTLIKAPFVSDAPTVANAAPPVRWSVVDLAAAVPTPAPAGTAPAPTGSTPAPATGPLPSWATLNEATGVISGTPAAGGGSASLVLVATDANGDAGRSQPFRITVSNGLAVTDVAASYPTRVGLPVTVVPGVTGTRAAVAWEVFTGNLPAWATFDDKTGRISGTPTGTGSIPLSLKVTDANGLEGYSAAFTLAVGEAMAITNVDAVVPARVGLPFAVSPTATGTVGAVTWDIQETLPTWATFDRPTGRVSGTPTSDGDLDFVILATDAGGGSASKAFKLSVAKNVIVTGLKPSYAVPGGGALATDKPTAQYASGAVRWTVQSGTLPAWATLVEATGVITGSPDRPGDATVTLRATDAEGTFGDSAAVTLTVTSGFSVTGPGNQDARVGVQGTTAAPVVAPAAAGATGPTAPVRWSLVGTKPGWAAFDASAGTFSGTPTKAESFPNLVLRATDAKGLQAYTQAFAITVAPAMKVAPLAASYVVRAGAKGAVYPVATDNIGAVEWSVANAPAWMTVNRSTGALTGRAPYPVPSPATFANVVLQAKDSKNFVVAGTPFSVTVAPGLGVSGIAPTYDGRQGYAFPDIVPVVTGGAALAWTSAGLPPGMSQDPGTGKVTGVPDASGTFQATLTVKDPSDDATVELKPAFTLARGLSVTGVASRMVARNGIDYAGKLPGLVGQRGAPTWSVVGQLPAWATVSPTTAASPASRTPCPPRRG